MAFNRSNCAFALCFLLIGILVGWMFDNGLARVLHAQFAEQARPADSRADAYAQLDSDARHLISGQRRRRVVQLSSPFVVHRKPRSCRTRRRCARGWSKRPVASSSCIRGGFTS